MLPRDAGQVAAERAGEVVDAEVDGAGRAAVGLARGRDAQLRRGDAGPVREGHERQADDEGGQPGGQREREPGGGKRERACGEPPPADPVGEPPHRGAEHAEEPEREDDAARSRPEPKRRPLEPVDHVRERADEREEERASRRRRLQQRPVAELAPEPAAPPTVRRRQRHVEQRAPHHEGGRERQDRQQSDPPAPAERGSEERDADAADQSAGDERGHVVAHCAPADPRREDLGDVRNAGREEARHAEALQGPEHEQEGEARCERRADRRGDEQRAREHDRAPAAVAVGERAPDPRAAGQGEHDDRDRQAGLRGADVERPAELRQDRLRRVGHGEHPRRAEQEAGHAAGGRG